MTQYCDTPKLFKFTLPTNFSLEKFFSRWSSQPYAAWLDSGQSEHPDANIDILVFDPVATLTAYRDDTEIHVVNENQTNKSTRCPFELAKELNQRLFPMVTNNTPFPFCGGAVGVFNYDLATRLEKLPTTTTQDIALPLMQLGFYHSAIIFDHKEKQLQLVTLLRDATQLFAEIETVVNTESLTHHNFQLSCDWQANMDQSRYTQKFNKVQDYLLAGDCYQINLAQRFEAKYQGDEYGAYCQLRNKNNAPFSAFFRGNNCAILSVSPERFLQVNQGKVQTKPIKGTLPRHSNAQQDKQNAQTLVNSSKDRAENLMIVDLLRNDISKVCIAGSVSVPKIFAIESFAAVHHLVSTIEGILAPPNSAIDALKQAFPGGSITGAPKIRAMQIIDELEPHQRSAYCGSIGYISACGNMDTNIAIRTMVCNNNNIYCWAGGGLVADSTAQSEYQETFDKVSSLLPVLSTLEKHD